MAQRKYLVQRVMHDRGVEENFAKQNFRNRRFRFILKKCFRAKLLFFLWPNSWFCFRCGSRKVKRGLKDLVTQTRTTPLRMISQQLALKSTETLPQEDLPEDTRRAHPVCASAAACGRGIFPRAGCCPGRVLHDSPTIYHRHLRWWQIKLTIKRFKIWTFCHKLFSSSMTTFWKNMCKVFPFRHGGEWVRLRFGFAATVRSHAVP